MKNIILFIVCLIILGVSIFLYKTRPYEAPTTETQTTNEPSLTTNTEPETDKISQKTLTIIPSESQASFSLNETLNGSPVHVVGTTEAISGNIVIDQLGKLEIGTIKVDARTLKTDNERRNGAIVRMILKSDQAGNEYITFEPTLLGGIPETIIPNKPFSYTITGNLTIQKTTKEIRFDATSTLKDDGTFVGTAKTTLDYPSFGISVPELSFLANVEKKTELEIKITAK